MEIAVADEMAGILRVLPFANSPGLGTIHYDSWEFAGRNDAGLHRPGYFSAFGCNRSSVLLCCFDLCLKAFYSRFVFAVNGFFRLLQRQWALCPFRYVRMLQRPDVPQNPGHRIVVASRDWIELVVVAARTTDGLCQESLAQCVQLLVHDIHFQLLLVLLLEIGVPQHQKCSCDKASLALLQSLVGHQIAGYLFSYESVIRYILVEGVDDVVAISPGFLKDQSAQRNGLAKTSHIQPVSPPTLAKTFGREQLVHHDGVSVRSSVLFKHLNFFRRRRQSSQVKINPPEPRRPLGIANGLKVLAFEFGKNEAIDVS